MGDDLILKFEFEPQNEWRVFRKSIPWHLLTITAFSYYLFTGDKDGILIGLFSLLYIVPQIVLHLQYRLTDKDKKLTVNYSKRIIYVENKGILPYEIRFSDIKKIIRYKGQRQEGNSIHALPIFFYNYTEIQLKNGEILDFSDFITKDLGLLDIEKEEEISFLNFKN